MTGKLVIIEGSDGSGKATQTERLYSRLKDGKLNVMKVEFPNYKSESSSLIKMYLNGEFGENPGDVNPYIASTFYAVDRFASFRKEWMDFYRDGGIILADRYTTSNMIHQAGKILDQSEKNIYLDWLWHFEFTLFELPVPDCVIFLDMPPEYSRRLMASRNNKFTGQEQKDIHEKDRDFIARSYENACYVAERYNWDRVQCIKGGNIRSVDEIHEEVYSILICKGII
ncbi:MAG: dTMP kinase [Acetivibrionales bacterium]|jgi:dTMP kinase